MTNKKNTRPLASVISTALVVVLLIGLGLAWLRRNSQPATQQTAQANTQVAVGNVPDNPTKKATLAPTVKPSQKTKQPAKATAQSNRKDPDLVVKNVQVLDYGSVVYEGDVDLNPTMERIAQGKRDSHANDGTTFSNREGKLPRKPRGYYTEYVLRTKGISGPGPQRVVLGEGGEIFYTPDHYASFIQVK